MHLVGVEISTELLAFLAVGISEDRVPTNLIGYHHFPTKITFIRYILLSSKQFWQFWGAGPSIIASNKRPAVLPTGDRQKYGANEVRQSWDSICILAEFGDTWK
jgi:hypothetical protein